MHSIVASRNECSKAPDSNEQIFFYFRYWRVAIGFECCSTVEHAYPVVASIAGRVFTKFHLDVGFGDAVVQPTELIKGRNWLDFAGIPPPDRAFLRCESLPKPRPA
jgi:hypothetical protein